MFAAYFLGVFVPQERHLAEKAWEGRLADLADDRREAVETWLRERTADAQVVAALPSVVSLLVPSSGGHKRSDEELDSARHLVNELDGLVGAGGYEGAYVLDARGRILGSSTGSRPLDVGCAEKALVALRGGSQQLIDLERDGTGNLHLAFSAPVAPSPVEGVAAAVKEDRAPGVVVLVTDPEKQLYSFLRPAGIPSASLEALLVEWRGGQLLYLSPLRHRPDRPLTLSVPAPAAPGLAAITAASRMSVFGEFEDYRGVRVLAATRRIAGTPWGLEVKVDRSEAMDRAVHEIRINGLAALGAFVALLGGVYGYSRSRRAALETAMVRSQARLGALLKHANDIVVFADLDGRLVDCNEAAVKAYGYERTELLKLGLADLREPSARERLNGDLARLRAQAVLRMEAQHVRKDGTVFPVEVVANVASAGPDVFIVGVIRDISERRQSEARIQLLNRLLRTISGINQLIVRERTRERLLDEVCRAIVEQGELRMAWVGFTDEQTGWVRPVAWAGLSEDYLRGIRIRWDESPLGRGPTGTAIREGHPVIANDFDNDERLVPWREQARAQGFRASAAFPLTGDGKVLGALNVYATEPGFFGAEIVSLLDELAGDLGFALDAIGAREAQQSSERKLQESEARLRAIYESSADAIGVSKAGTQVMVNPAYAAMFGYERPEDLQGRSILELIAPSSREVVRDLVERRARGEPVPSTYGARGLRRDGSELDMEVRVSTYTHLGELFALVVLRDITERRRAEAALAESEARYRITAEMTGKLVYDYDVASGQVAWQGAISRLTGFTHEEFQAVDIRLWEEMIHPDDRERAIGLLDEAARGDGNYSVRYRFRRKDGSHIHVSDEGVFLKDATGRAVRMFGTMGDVTGEVVLEAQLRQAQKMEAVGNLAGGVAHDFNNLLQAILSLVEVLKAQQDDPARAAERLRELEENVRRGAQFTRQLLLFSRREATKREVLDLNAVLHGAAGMMRRLLRENIAVKLELAPGELPVEADRGQLEQVVANLSLNAADAMPDGGTVAISSGAEERGVWFEVTDTGSGIEESIRDRIFEPFFTTKGSGKGTGLGLSVVHGIVTGHGGSIELTSAVGEGSRFRITLTRAARHRDDSCGLVSEFPDALAAGWGELVLVVEDEPGAREGLREILTLLGYRATAVGSGEEALALPDEPAFDLLLTDVMLPGNPGPEVARLLRERWPALEVILMSGYAEDVAVRRIVTMGHVNFLQKPFDMATLAREIRAALKR